MGLGRTYGERTSRRRKTKGLPAGQRSRSVRTSCFFRASILARWRSRDCSSQLFGTGRRAGVGKVGLKTSETVSDDLEVAISSMSPSVEVNGALVEGVEVSNVITRQSFVRPLTAGIFAPIPTFFKPESEDLGRCRLLNVQINAILYRF